ncbi:S8 family peptidase [Peribacillus kribbensis]|uniref:S8 family peptidase n=1 Tax=Peribacillus kribbensis TaxID=356658 RepID=UPI00040646AA|nr:S8 family peptidase [Peribacillus kribbensis]
MEQEQVVRVIPYELVEQIEDTSEVPGGVELIQAPKIWDKTMGKGSTIAVLDTGCDITHPDLKDRIKGGKNFTGDDGGREDIYQDYNGHGTHVAGTMAASMNKQGVIGVAPEADLLIVKVLNKNGSGKYEWIKNGILFAIEQGADIISMSLGGPSDDKDLHDAIKLAVSKNIQVVCAAGNEGDGDDKTDELGYPACYNEVISVGAINLQRRSSNFTNSNNEVDLVAPGEGILSTYKNGKYATLSGTSMSAPHAAGALALIKVLTEESFGRKLTGAELYAQLIKRTIPLGYTPKLEGNGLLYLTAIEYLTDIFKKEAAALLVHP